MGLIQAAVYSANQVLSNQWKEYFYCEALPNDILVTRGRKRINGKTSNSNDNIITSGSVVSVADGQCMIIVDQGKVAEFCAEPGEFQYDASTAPSFFGEGKLGSNIKEVIASIGQAFTFGGTLPKDQRVYYFNIKEITGNKYGTPSPVPFRVVDERAGIDLDISLKCFGEYSYRISNPLLFYANVCGNITSSYEKDQLDAQLKTELLTALQPAFARISAMGIRYSAVPAHTMELADALNAELSKQWRDRRGIEIVAIGVSSLKASEEDEKMIKEMQRMAAFTNPTMGAAYIINAQGQAMQDAAKNANGAAMGFMGMNMAQQAGGMDAQALYAMGMAQQAQAKPAQPQAAPAPAPQAGWTCSCGTVNQGKFCMECGAKKPAGALQYKCDKCGWVPADPANPPKFCPECGDPFGDEDIVS